MPVLLSHDRPIVEITVAFAVRSRPRRTLARLQKVLLAGILDNKGEITFSDEALIFF